MRRAQAIGWLALGALLHLALRQEQALSWPEPVRVAAALFALVLLPGLAFVRLAGAPPGGAWTAPGWALGYGVLWNAALVMALHFSGQPFTRLAALAPVTSLLPWAAALLEPARPHEPDPDRIPAWAGLAIWAAAGLAAWAGFVIGPPMTWNSDTPDHVGTIRRMLETGQVFPSDAFFRDAGALGVDPRKGLWHPQVALVAKLASADAEATWRALSGCLAPLFALNAAALGVKLGGPVSGALAGWALVLTYGGAFSSPPLREAMFSTKLADQLSLATLTALVCYAADARRGALAATVLLALAAVSTHLFAVLHLGLAGAALAVAMAVRDRGIRDGLKRLLGAGLVAAALALPYLLWRMERAYAPVNPIHTEPQGLLVLAGSLRTVSIGVLWEWMGHLWVLFPLAWIPLWRFGRDNVAALLLLASSLAVAVVMFVPPVVALLEPRLGYLLMRFVWIPPLAGLIAWLVPELARRTARGPAAARAGAGVLLALLGVMLADNVRDAVALVRAREAVAARQRLRSAEPWRDALEWMRDSLPRGSVVLSDPATSYTIPMATGHYVTTLVDQHSSPNDSLALRRILDARDALDPWADWERTRDVIARHHVTAVALNDRFPEPPLLEYWGPRPEWFRAARARLDREPRAFRKRFDTGDFVVYDVRPGELAKLEGGAAPRPFVRPANGLLSVVARRLGDGLPALVSAVPASRLVAPGDTLAIRVDWRAFEPLPAGSWSVPVRFDRALPWGFEPPRWLGKPTRKLIERFRGERYRFREDHVPVGGAYGVDLWRTDEIVRDSFTVVVPRDALEGVWTVSVGVVRDPVYPNYRVSDYFFDEDYYAGLPVTTILVTSRRSVPTAGRPAGSFHGGRPPRVAGGGH